MAVQALVTGGHAGRTYSLTGPEALTVPQRVRTIAEAIGRNIRFVELTEATVGQRAPGSLHLIAGKGPFLSLPGQEGPLLTAQPLSQPETVRRT